MQLQVAEAHHWAGQFWAASNYWHKSLRVNCKFKGFNKILMLFLLQFRSVGSTEDRWSFQEESKVEILPEEEPNLLPVIDRAGLTSWSCGNRRKPIVGMMITDNTGSKIIFRKRYLCPSGPQCCNSASSPYPQVSPNDLGLLLTPILFLPYWGKMPYHIPHHPLTCQAAGSSCNGLAFYLQADF